MMTQKKRLTIIILVILLIILLLGGAFAFLYFGTDLFKTNQQLFYQYAAQNGEVLALTTNPSYQSQKDVLNQKAYSFSGNVTFQCSNVEDSDIYNQMRLEFEGQENVLNQKRFQTTTIKQEDQDIFQWRYLKTGEVEGLISDEVVNKYVSMENPSMGKVLSLFGNNTMPDVKINSEQLDFSAFTSLTEEQKSQMQQTYLTILFNEIPQTNYQKQKDIMIEIGDQQVQTNAYELTLSETELSKVLLALLEQAKQDQTLLNAIQNFSKNNITTEQIQDSCDEGINNLKKQETTDEQAVRITVYEREGSLVKTEVELKDYIIEWNLEQLASGDILSIAVNDKEGNTIAELQIEKKTEELEYDVAFSFYSNGSLAGKVVLQYVDKINNGQTEEVKATVGVNINGSTVQVNYQNTRNYQDQIEIEELTTENSVNLSQSSQEEARSLLTAVQARMEQLYTDKIVAIGLSGNPIFSPDIVIQTVRDFLQGNNSNANVNAQLDEQMIHAFNAKFELYATLEKDEKTVEGIIRTTYEHNQTYADEPDKQVHLVITGQDFGNLQNYVLDDLITQVKNATSSYLITFDYDETTKLIKNVNLNV